MSGGKLSPRQKMINMMYLVLIALLALNVSKEIIKAFNLMENSLNTSTKNIQSKNKLALEAIQSESAEKADARAAFKYAKEAKVVADAFVKMIDNVKADLEANTDGRMTDPANMLVKGGVAELVMGDNMEIHSNYFLLEKGNQRKDGKPFAFNPTPGKMRGETIFDMINNTRTKLLAVLDAAAKDPDLGGKKDSGFTMRLLKTAATDLAKKTALVAENQKNQDGKLTSWVSMYLEHSPLAGVFALLSKYQNDARSLQSEITSELAKSVNASKIKFDQTMAVISTPSSAVLQGQTYEADLILAAYDSKSDLKMTVGNNPVEVKAGIGKYKVTASSPGEFTYKVQIAVPGPAGVEMKVAEGKYTVFPPIAAISADELNVFYVGLDNPISVAVAGVDSRNVNVSCTNGQLVAAGAGKYKVLIPVRKANDCIISVSAKMSDGRIVSMGSKKFRIRSVPKPVFRAGAIAFDKDVQLAALKVQGVAAAVLENFVYEGVKYSIQSFTFTGLGRRGPIEQKCTGASLAPIKGILNNMGPGEYVMFTDIRAVGPSGPVYLESAVAKLR